MKLILLACLLFAGCTKSKGADSSTIEIQTAPDGSKCYVLIQGDEAKGISCK